MRRLTEHGQTVMVDRNDAPKGYYPVPKDVVHPINELSPNRNENICKACDWRPNCSGINPCMSDKRADGISVVFKKEEIKHGT